MLRYDPAVFAVGNDYQIAVTSKTQAFISIKVGNELFIDDSNGILCSASKTHIFSVPQELLEKEKHYTVIEKGIIKRLPYFSRTRADKFYEYDFIPVPEKAPVAYHISDTHNLVSEPVAAANAYGDFDFLILNGDVPNDTGRPENLYVVFDIISQLTHGTKPVVFSRGNHDLRGICAEMFAQYTPSRDGKTYYSFRLGKLWGICLDCGEDKPDSNEEYGCTVACHQFRIKETEYIKEVIANAGSEYNAPDVTHRIIIAHNPFTRHYPAPFNIEEDLYSEWAKMLKENVKPDVMICGHTHRYSIDEPGCENDALGQPCPIVVAAYKDDKTVGGAAFTFDEKEIGIVFTDNKGFREEHKIKL
ncbi:MAG: metallophosphoesterase [Clostridia bacterium]|nr:metallophosphoesterase [Clostridia bacterium]